MAAMSRSAAFPIVEPFARLGFERWPLRSWGMTAEFASSRSRSVVLLRRAAVATRREERFFLVGEVSLTEVRQAVSIPFVAGGWSRVREDEFGDARRRAREPEPDAVERLVGVRVVDCDAKAVVSPFDRPVTSEHTETRSDPFASPVSSNRHVPEPADGLVGPIFVERDRAEQVAILARDRLPRRGH